MLSLLAQKLREAGFVAEHYTSSHQYVVAGTEQKTNCAGISAINDAIMITCEPTWLIQTSWEESTQDIIELDFDSILAKTIELLSSRRQLLSFERTLSVFETPLTK